MRDNELTDSDIPWPMVCVAEVCTVATGGTPSTSHPEYYDSGTIRWMKSGDVHTPFIYEVLNRITENALHYSAAKVFPVGTVVIALSGRGRTRGTVALLQVPSATSQSIGAMIPNPSRLLGQFLYFNLASRYKEIRSLTGDMDRSGLNLGHLRSLVVPLPPLSEQQAIGHVLRTVQQAQEATAQVIAAARQLKQSLLRHLFTYGPVPFDQADRVALKETEVGLVPEAWQLLRLGNLIGEGPQNGLYMPESFYGRGFPIVRIDDFGNKGEVIENAAKRVQLEDAEARKYALQPGDLLVNRVNSLSHLGKTALVGRLAERTVFESNMMRFRLRPGIVQTAYIFRFLCSPGCRTVLRGAAKRAVAQSSINQGDVKALPVPLPSATEQTEIVAALDAVDRKLQVEGFRAAALQALFQSLLHHLMTGKVRVHDLPGLA